MEEVHKQESLTALLHAYEISGTAHFLLKLHENLLIMLQHQEASKLSLTAWKSKRKDVFLKYSLTMHSLICLISTLMFVLAIDDVCF